MSAGHSFSSEQAKGPHRRQKRGNRPEDNRRRGAANEFIRTAGPHAIGEHLFSQEATLFPAPTLEKANYDPDPAADFEMNMDDEDLAPVEAWHDPTDSQADNVTLGDLEPLHRDFSASDCFVLLVSNGICSFQEPSWAPMVREAKSLTSERASDCEFRLNIFRGLASWLNANRGDFLRDPSVLWNLGPSTLAEAQTYCAVLQKSLREMLKIPSLTEEALSRFLQACNLVWAESDLDTPVQFLFSPEAAEAWAARTVGLWASQYFRGDLAAEMRACARSGQVAKIDVKSKLRLTAAEELKDVIQQVCRRTRTKWSDVLRQYEPLIIHEFKDQQESASE